MIAEASFCRVVHRLAWGVWARVPTAKRSICSCAKRCQCQGKCYSLLVVETLCSEPFSFRIPVLNADEVVELIKEHQ